MSDNWDFYFCRVEDRPASIFVDLGIGKDVPIAGLDDMTWLGLYLRQPREDGLYSEEEYNRLLEIEDALNEALANADIKIVYVGRNTSNGCRDFYFYTENGILAESCLSMVLVSFPEYEFEVGSRPDPEWSIYREFLYPSPRAYQTIMNHHVLAGLKEHGDQHDIEREVTHWVHFDSEAKRARFLAAAVQKGYKLVGQNDDDKGERTFGIAGVSVKFVGEN